MSGREELSEQVAHAMYVAEYPWWNELGWDHWSDGSMASMGLRDRCFAMVDAVLAEIERTHVLVRRDGLDDRIMDKLVDDIGGDEWALRAAAESIVELLTDLARDAPAGEG